MPMKRNRLFFLVGLPSYQREDHLRLAEPRAVALHYLSQEKIYLSHSHLRSVALRHLWKGEEDLKTSKRQKKGDLSVVLLLPLLLFFSLASLSLLHLLKVEERREDCQGVKEK